MELTRMLTEQILAMVLMGLAGFIAGKAKVITGETSLGLSAACVYVIVPCALVNAFRTEFDVAKLEGMAVAALTACAIHGTYLIIAEKVFSRGKYSMTPGERASTIYSNSGNLIIPLVQETLGAEYVIYTCSYQLVQNFLIWTHGQRLMGGKQTLSVKAIFTNSNIISIFLGLALFILGIELPGALGTAVASLGGCLGPLCMMVVGILLAEMDLKKVLASWAVWRTVAVRLLVFPGIVLALLWAVSLVWKGAYANSVLLVVQLCASGPSASLVTQMAQLYHSPEKGLVSSVNALSTMLCALTLPLMCTLFQLFVG